MKIAAIIPAFNEEKTVANVVRAIKESPEVSEVIVVNDASTDRTGDCAQAAGARVINLAVNTGKGGAVKAGLDSTRADCLLLLDADLLGLNQEHIRLLLEPVALGQADMSVGVFGNGRLLTDLAQIVAPQLSGQRAVRRAVLEAVSSLDLTRYGVEIVLTRYARSTGLRVETVHLPHLSHVMKEEKMGFVPGFKARMKMYWDIVRWRRFGGGVGN